MKLSYSTCITLVVGLLLALCHVGDSFVPNPTDLLNIHMGGLTKRFYKGRCPHDNDIQDFIEAEVAKYFYYDPTLLPAFLRLQFHDCFVNGCDASITIEGDSTERAAPANAGVRDFKVIDDLKASVEARCPGVVSCADIIAIATKVVLEKVGVPGFQVETGRRDGLQSVKEDVKLPHPSLSVDETFKFFEAKQFSRREMVALLGCHTVGITHCQFFQQRLYNDNSAYDPDMKEDLRQELMKTCPQGTSSNNVAYLDQSVGYYSQSVGYYSQSDAFDNAFYSQILDHRGVLPIDQAIAGHPSTAPTVHNYAYNSGLFKTDLRDAMLKLQRVDVKTGLQGNIRKVCSKFN